MKYKLKEVKNVWKFVGTEEVDMQEYEFGMITPEFCLLWKDGKLPNKRIIKSFLELSEDSEKLKNQETPR